MHIISDSSEKHFVYRLLPEFLIPYAQLARLDRAVGYHLLLGPCLISAAFAFVSPNGANVAFSNLIYYIFLFFIGSVIMRGAGCCLNDIFDRDIDKKVERTKFRPLACGSLSISKALIFLFVLCILGFIILWQFNILTIICGTCSLFLVAFYPLTKRISCCPQLFLGLCFGWGAILAWTALKNSLDFVAFYCYLSAIFWIVGYDTIYALQDINDDKKIGIASCAILFQHNIYAFLFSCYGLALLFLALALYQADLSYIYYVALLYLFLHFAWQLYNLDVNSPKICLSIFKTNCYIAPVILLIFLLIYYLRI